MMWGSLGGLWYWVWMVLHCFHFNTNVLLLSSAFLIHSSQWYFFSFYSCLFKLSLKRQITEFKEMSRSYTYINFPAHFRKTQLQTFKQNHSGDNLKLLNMRKLLNLNKWSGICEYVKWWDVCMGLISCNAYINADWCQAKGCTHLNSVSIDF